jgi:hypothetical protein
MSLVNVLVRAGTFNFKPADVHGDADPSLAFMLAQQKTTQLQIDADRMETTAEAGLDTGPIVSEAELSLQQIGALRDRIEPFANYVDMAIRFEAQEVLAALDRIDIRMERLVWRLKPNLPWRDPAQLVVDLLARAH